VGEAYETITFKFSDDVYKVSIPNYLGLWWIFFIILHTVQLRENVIANFGNVNTSMALEICGFTVTIQGGHTVNFSRKYCQPNILDYWGGCIEGSLYQHCKGVQNI
jgi:hypothetical protein